MVKILQQRAQKLIAFEAKKAKADESNNFRICRAKFLLDSYKRTLNSRHKIIKSSLPKIFKLYHVRCDKTYHIYSIKCPTSNKCPPFS